jgi:hypothetical protein
MSDPIVESVANAVADHIPAATAPVAPAVIMLGAGAELIRFGDNLPRCSGPSLPGTESNCLSKLNQWLATAERVGSRERGRSTQGANDIGAATAGNDFHLMGSADGIFFSDAGDDTVIGGQANDIIFSDTGHDLLYGSGGDDSHAAGGNIQRRYQFSSRPAQRRQLLSRL